LRRVKPSATSGPVVCVSPPADGGDKLIWVLVLRPKVADEVGGAD
jgi:hypothetical protein